MAGTEGCVKALQAARRHTQPGAVTACDEHKYHSVRGWQHPHALLSPEHTPGTVLPRAHGRWGQRCAPLQVGQGTQSAPRLSSVTGPHWSRTEQQQPCKCFIHKREEHLVKPWGCCISKIYLKHSHPQQHCHRGKGRGMAMAPQQGKPAGLPSLNRLPSPEVLLIMDKEFSTGNSKKCFLFSHRVNLNNKN